MNEYVLFVIHLADSTLKFSRKAASNESSKQIDPYLESVIEINPDAQKIAAVLDDERRRGIVRSALHGVPVLVKDVGEKQSCKILLTGKEHGHKGQNANDGGLMGFAW